MGKFMKSNIMDLILARCYSRHKVVIMKNIDDSTPGQLYSHALGARIDHKLTTIINKMKIVKRSKIKSFMKVYNYNHLMPHKVLCGYSLGQNHCHKDFFRDPTLNKTPRKSNKYWQAYGAHQYSLFMEFSKQE
ncbi:hypothetical protein FD755_002351 [Muntiacus reevesi]|uniref:60S ribosomal protein L27 n=1 Tax=Muntiacus reevesi TaxID=9886 RepID=A0A5J5N401_MUNRE|nr:hypothetical protein FD755_002351 [Muntiacus reevesi]